MKELAKIKKFPTMVKQMQYAIDRKNELYMNASLYQMVFAGGTWRVRAANKLYEKVFEYFPEEANDSPDALTFLADTYAWLGWKNNTLKAISLYREAIEVFKRKHLTEETPPGIDTKDFELKKYNYLIIRHDLIAKNYMEMKDYNNVIKEYQVVIDGYSDNVKGFSLWDQYLLVGDAYKKIGETYLSSLHDYKEAIKYFTKVQELFPVPLVISINRTYVGDCYLAMGDDVKAKEIYQSVISEFKDSKDIVHISSAMDALKDLKRWKRIATKYDPIL